MPHAYYTARERALLRSLAVRAVIMQTGRLKDERKWQLDWTIYDEAGQLS